MVLETTAKVVLGSIAFSIFWVLAVFPAVPFLPIGRTAGSLLGAMLMVILRILSPDEAYGAIDLPILGLLFGTMVVSAFLERADMFKYLGKLLSWKSWGCKDLLFRVCLISAFSSALFTNDTVCVVLTEFVLKLAKQNDLPAQPFLLALASNANIGSSATPIGNPQNLVIAVRSGISFGTFLRGLIGPMLLGVLINAAILLGCFWNILCVDKKDIVMTVTIAPDDDDSGVETRVMNSHRFSPATMAHRTLIMSEDINVVLGSISVASIGDINSFNGLPNESTEIIEPSVPELKGTGNNIPDAICAGELVVLVSPSSSIQTDVVPIDHQGKELVGCGKWKKISWKVSVYLVTLGMLIALLTGLNLSWTAITAALVLVVIDFRDAQPCLEKVSYSLLIFFCGMFITVDGFNKTGIPSALWDLVEPYAKINSASGVALLSMVVLVLSNIASNVPTVLLLGSRVASSAAKISEAEVTKAWLILAFVSTIAGNLSLLGSAANLIVCEQARRVQFSGYNLSFFSHLRFGVPSTLVVTTMGLLLIYVS